MTPMPIHMWFILTIIIVAGIFGGFVNFYLAKPDDLPTPTRSRSVIIGIAASSLVPLFLNMISSNLIDLIKGGDTTKLLVLFGFCLVAAISSTAFIRTLSDRVLSEARQAKREAREAKTEISEVHEKIQPIVEKETETDPNEESLISPLGTTDLPEIGQKLLKALSGSKWTLRTEHGLAREIAADKKEVEAALQDLLNRGLVGRSDARAHGIRWFATATGRLAAKQFDV